MYKSNKNLKNKIISFLLILFLLNINSSTSREDAFERNEEHLVYKFNNIYKPSFFIFKYMPKFSVKFYCNNLNIQNILNIKYNIKSKKKNTIIWKLTYNEKNKYFFILKSKKYNVNDTINIIFKNYYGKYHLFTHLPGEGPNEVNFISCDDSDIHLLYNDYKFLQKYW
jgi:hypothetical protein